MSCKVKIPTPLRRHTAGASAVEVTGEHVREALDDLLTRYPTIGERLFDGQGQVKPHLNIFLNNEDIRFLGGLDTPLRDGDTVVLLPALAGGSKSFFQF
jgi:molybdopterin synthase sulfur carrier subunit